MMQVPEISIIIVSYNVKDLLFKSIESVKKYSSKVPVEIIVIDNHSTDGTVDYISGLFPEIIIIVNNYNAGFPEANNQGLRIATGKYIFLLNPDTELFEDSITVLKDFVESNENVGVVAPQLLNTDGSIQKSIYRFPKLSYIIAEMFYLRFLVKEKYYGDTKPGNIIEVDSASGAALFFKKSLIDAIGYLNEKLFWIEDIDFCFRVKKTGKKIMYVPLTKIIHHSGQSAKTNYNVSISNQLLNKIKYFKIHGGALDLFLVYIFTTLNVILRILIFGLLSPFNEVFYQKFKAYIFTLPKIFTATRGL